MLIDDRLQLLRPMDWAHRYLRFKGMLIRQPKSALSSLTSIQEDRFSGCPVACLKIVLKIANDISALGNWGYAPALGQTAPLDIRDSLVRDTYFRYKLSGAILAHCHRRPSPFALVARHRSNLGTEFEPSRLPGLRKSGQSG